MQLLSTLLYNDCCLHHLQYCLTVNALFLSGDDNENKSRSDKCHTSGKRKKKKRRRKEEDSSDSDTECASPKRANKCAQSSSPRLVEELPDIIPKQVKSHRNESKNSVQLCDIMCECSLIDLNSWKAVKYIYVSVVLMILR